MSPYHSSQGLNPHPDRPVVGEATITQGPDTLGPDATITQGPDTLPADEATITQSGECPSYIPSAATFSNTFNYCQQSLGKIYNDLVQQIGEILNSVSTNISDSYQQLYQQLYNEYEQSYSTITQSYGELINQINQVTGPVSETINYYGSVTQGPDNITIEPAPVTIVPCPADGKTPEPKKPDPCNVDNDWQWFNTTCADDFVQEMQKPANVATYNKAEADYYQKIIIDAVGDVFSASPASGIGPGIGR